MPSSLAPAVSSFLAGPPRVVVVGASVRAAVDSLRRAGCVPWACDLFADVDLLARAPVIRARSYPDGLVDAAERLPVAPWLFTGGLENHPDLLVRLARRAPLLGVAPDVCRRVRDPQRVAAAFAAAGAPFPETRSTPPPPATADEWLWKPSRSSGGLGVRRATPRDASEPPRGAGVFQRLVAGESIGATFLSDPARGTELVGVARQLNGPDWGLAPGFAYGGSIGPRLDEPTRRARLERLGQSLAAEFPLVGLWGVDLIDDGRDLHALEVNPRYTASVEVLEAALGRSLAAEHLRACGLAVAPAPPSPAADRVCGKAIVYARRDLRVSARLFERLGVWREARPAPLAADLPAPGALVPAATPLATVFARGATPDEVERRLRERVAECLDD